MTNLHTLAFMGLGPVELMLVGVAAVLLFGRNLPSVARSAGKSLTEFKKGMQELQDEVRVSIDTDSHTVASNRSKPIVDEASADEAPASDEANEADTSEEEESFDEGYPSVRTADNSSDDGQY